MKFKTIMAAAAAMTMTASPVLAAATNPASSLSVARSARAGTPTATKSALGGGGAGIYALLVLAGVAAIIVVEATHDDSPNSR